jgi:hypothetical protein
MSSPSSFKRKKPNDNFEDGFENKAKHFKEEARCVFDDDSGDDDMIGISDTELIQVSQLFESKYYSSQHVSNQYGSTQTPMPMAPPLSTRQPKSNACRPNEGNPLPASNEISRLREENFQKNGEVKILRNKLTKLEQEMNRLRNEKIDLVKKLNQRHEDEEKNYKKQIEAKEVQIQFKCQEIMQLTMRNKQLESLSNNRLPLTIQVNQENASILEKQAKMKSEQTIQVKAESTEKPQVSYKRKMKFNLKDKLPVRLKNLVGNDDINHQSANANFITSYKQATTTANLKSNFLGE